MTNFITKDSWAREEYPSGMRRDTQKGKRMYTLIPTDGLDRLSELMWRWAVKYGRNNWELADSPEELQRFKDSAFRHFMSWIKEEYDEDHASATVFNIFAYEHIKKKINARETKRKFEQRAQMILFGDDDLLP